MTTNSPQSQDELDEILDLLELNSAGKSRLRNDLLSWSRTTSLDKLPTPAVKGKDAEAKAFNKGFNYCLDLTKKNMEGQT